MATTKRSVSTNSTKASGNGRPKARDTRSKRKKTAAEPVHLVPWKAQINSYAHPRALTFMNYQDFRAAIDLVWTEALREMPHALPGGFTMIVPPEAVPFFAKSGLQFEDTEVLSAGDLPPEEISKLRKEQGFF